VRAEQPCFVPPIGPKPHLLQVLKGGNIHALLPGGQNKASMLHMWQLRLNFLVTTGLGAHEIVFCHIFEAFGLMSQAKSNAAAIGLMGGDNPPPKRTHWVPIANKNPTTKYVFCSFHFDSGIAL
jgi:hypothetical protein